MTRLPLPRSDVAFALLRLAEYRDHEVLQLNGPLLHGARLVKLTCGRAA